MRKVWSSEVRGTKYGVRRCFNLVLRTSYFVLLLTLVSACSHTLNIPKPGSAPSAPPPPIEASEIEIPITTSLAPLFQQIEAMVPKKQSAARDWTKIAENAVGDVGIKYEAWRDQLQLTATGNTLRIGGRIHYWMEVAQRVPKPIVGGHFWQELASCGKGEPPRQAQLWLETKTGWSDAWQLTTTTSVRPIEYPNRCQVTFIKYDVTSKVDEAFRTGLQQAAAAADAQMRKLGDIRPHAENAWRGLQQPIELDSAMWLVVDPVAAYVAPLNASGGSITATIGVTARPRVVFGPKPAVQLRPLPKLQVKTPSGGAHIAIEGSVSFHDASRMLARALVGREFNTVGHTITIAEASVYGAGEIAVVQVKLAGDVEGTIYMIGKPAYDAKSNTLYIDGLDFSLDTKNALANAADWFSHESMRQSIAESARWPLGDAMASARKDLAKQLGKSTGKSFDIVGGITAMRPIGIYTTTTGFIVRAIADANVKVVVQ